MRSIGKVKIRKLKQIITDELIKESKNTNYPYRVNSNMDFNIVEKNIKNRIPDNWYNTWEMAYQEINRIIYDTITNAVRFEFLR
jgi:hypothetical protein